MSNQKKFHLKIQLGNLALFHLNPLLKLILHPPTCTHRIISIVFFWFFFQQCSTILIFLYVPAMVDLYWLREQYMEPIVIVSLFIKKYANSLTNNKCHQISIWNTYLYLRLENHHKRVFYFSTILHKQLLFITTSVTPEILGQPQD